MLFHCVLLVAGLLLSSSTALQAQQGHLCWREGTKLRWRDFQAAANELAADSSLAPAAYAATELHAQGFVDSSGRNNFLVRVSFNQRRAWVRDTTVLLADEILAHEQLHFDICELVGRQLRQRVAQAYQAGQDVFAPAFTKEVQGFLRQEDILQELYDQQTDHGLAVEMQRRWSERVRSDLAKLRRFVSTAATCQFD